MKAKANKVRAQRGPFLEKVAGFMPVARGSLALVRKACGKPGCRACKSGRKHPAWLLVYREAICAEGLAYLDSLVAEAAQ